MSDAISSTKRRDWYKVDFETATPLFGLPGVGFDGTNILAHRSHMPLLEHPDAAKIIAPPLAPSQYWEARNITTQARGFTLRVTQHQAIDFIARRRGTLLGDDMRLGKGHVAGTRLLGPSGWLAIEAARVGHRVMGSDGKAYAITGVFPRGRLKVFRVSFSDGASIVVDGEHLWTAWSHNHWHRGKPPQTLSTAELQTKLRDLDGKSRWRIPLVKPLKFVGCRLPLDPYLLGVLLGDGSLSQDVVTFCCGDEETPAEVAKVLPPGVRLNRGHGATRATTWGISRLDPAGSNPVRRALDDLGLAGARSETKFVPGLYLFASVADRISLLQGLLDTDGEYCDGILAFSSASEALRDAVRFLVESLGGVARAGIRKEPKYAYKGEMRVGRPSYRLTIAMPDGIEPFRARKGYQPRTKFKPTRHIISIEPEGEAEVICISVDAPNRLYVTEHCIVTHNTLSALMTHRPETGPLVVIAPLNTRAMWLGWIRRVFPELADKIGITIGRKIDLQILNRPIVFAHYDLIQHWQSMTKIGTLVFDEAHALTNPRAKRTLAAALMASRSERVIAMTGTPIWKLPPDLWSVLGLVAPGAWGSHFDFSQRYGAPVSTAYGPKYTGASHESELNARLSDVMLRRRWVDVMDDLPAITRSVVVAEVNDAERRKLDICAAKLKSERSNTAGNLSAYRRQVTGIKLVDAVREATKIMDRGEPVVIWTWHKDYANAIAAALGTRAVVIHGDIEADNREARIMHWRGQPASALIATMAVAQVGIDLSHARFAIFAEIDYTPAVLGQAEMRTFSPTRPMDVIFIVANHIVDQRIVRALVSKLGAQDSLGVGAACDAIDALREAVMGPTDTGDLDRMLEDLIAGHE